VIQLTYRNDSLAENLVAWRWPSEHSRAGLRRERVDAVLRSGMEQHRFPAVSAVAGTGDAITYSGALGTRDPSPACQSRPSRFFAIASMTKAVTSVGAIN